MNTSASIALIINWISLTLATCGFLILDIYLHARDANLLEVVRGGLKVTRDVIVVAAGATSAIAAVVTWVQSDSSKNSCSSIGESGQSDNGQQKNNFKYWVTTTGKNCDTTAQTKTVATALDDAWDDVHKRNYNYACIDMSHGGTWHGHLAMATVQSGQDVNTMCNTLG
ncbi:hypothetical protein N7486_006045 [Penicillium sp. IBT 16267x]|nr:hypothetical protein N7486_006045 [Penicillium sp. IBT 16267x]